MSELSAEDVAVRQAERTTLLGAFSIALAPLMVAILLITLILRESAADLDRLDRATAMIGVLTGADPAAVPTNPEASDLIDPRAALQPPQGKVAAGRDAGFETTGQRSDTRSGTAQSLHTAQLDDMRRLRASASEGDSRTLSLALGAILLSLIAAIWQSHRFVRPIRNLARDLAPHGRARTTFADGARRDLVGLLARSIERSVRQNTDRLQTALCHAPIATIIEDLNGGHVRHNPAMIRFLRITEDQIQRRSLSDFMSKTDRAALETQRRAFATDKSDSLESEIAFRRPDGSELWGMTTRNFVRGSGGMPDFVVTQIQDISEIKRMEGLTQNFISTVSHELRTPLTAVLAAIGMLQAKMSMRSDAGETRLLEIAHNNCNRLLVLINDLLDLERLSHGGVRMQMDRHDVTDIASSTMTELEPYVRGMKQKLLPLACSGSHHAWTDAIRISQILSNLITNATKFSPPRSEIRVAIEEENKIIRFSVTDRGPGVDPALGERIFAPFKQADGSAKRNPDGAGVGLNLAKGLIEQLGGTIGYRNNDDRGATFFFTLPAMGVQSDGASDPLPGKAAGTGPPPGILHVENDPPFAARLADVLGTRARLTPACSYRQAKRLLDETDFDLVLIDWELPDGSGMDLLHHPAISGSSVPVISLSANPDLIRPARAELNITKSAMPIGDVAEIILRVLARRDERGTGHTPHLGRRLKNA